MANKRSGFVRLSDEQWGALHALSVRIADMLSSKHGWAISIEELEAAGAFDVAGARAKNAPRRGAHLYLVEVDDVCVKVGVSTRPSGRIAQHARAAAQMGRSIGRCLVTPWHRRALSIEKLVKSDGRNGEYLNVGFDEAVEQLYWAISKFS